MRPFAASLSRATKLPNCQRARNALGRRQAKTTITILNDVGSFFVLSRCVPCSPGWQLGTRWMSPSVAVFNRQEAFALSQYIAILIIALCYTCRNLLFGNHWDTSFVFGNIRSLGSETPLIGIPRPLVTPISYRKETSLFFLRISSQTGHKYHLFQGFYSILVAGVCKVENLPQAK